MSRKPDTEGGTPKRRAWSIEGHPQRLGTLDSDGR